MYSYTRQEKGKWPRPWVHTVQGAQLSSMVFSLASCGHLPKLKHTTITGVCVVVGYRITPTIIGTDFIRLRNQLTNSNMINLCLLVRLKTLLIRSLAVVYCIFYMIFLLPARNNNIVKFTYGSKKDLFKQS